MTLREKVERDIANGLKAKIRTDDGIEGVYFYDADVFVPFDELAYNQQTGYTQIGRPVLRASVPSAGPAITYIRPCNAEGEPITWVGVGIGIAWGAFLLSIPIIIMIALLTFFFGIFLSL